MSFGIPVRNGLGLGLRASTTLSTRRGVALPSLSLDFLTMSALPASITFTRGSSATFVGSNGYIQTASTNTPRFDYDPVTLAAKGLLIEEQRTNLQPYSNFTAAQWDTGGGTTTLTNNSITGPDGTASMTLVTESAGTGSHVLYSGPTSVPTVVAGATYTASIYLKAGTRRYVQMSMGASASGLWGVVVDTTNMTIVATGATGTATYTSSSITNVGNGIYRVAVTGTFPSTLGYMGTAGVGTPTFTTSVSSSGSQTWYCYGIQLEAGAFATSYIPTVASSVTRSADIATMTGTNFSSWYNQTQGAFVVSGDSAGGAVSGLYEASTSGTAAQSISVRLGQKFSYAQGLNRFDFSYTAGNVIRHGFAYLAGNYGAAVGGTALTVNANGQPADVPAGANQLALGCLGSGTFLLNGHIRTLSYYNTRLTNTQLQALTA